MKRQIRRGVFETNSSSTHSVSYSLHMCSEDIYDKWKNGELVFDRNKEEFVEVSSLELTNEDKESVKASYNNKKQKYWKDWEDLSDSEVAELYAEKAREKMPNYRFRTYEYYMMMAEDVIEEHYTTPNGEEIVCFGEIDVNTYYD